MPDKLGYLLPVSKIYSPPDLSIDGPQITSELVGEVITRRQVKIRKNLKKFSTNLE
ncbi:hypothetical protein [Leptospira levettii]|uniref:hypothetical protein n=1 Tax=Leptospira levettii TaxID=2023178 RepID=UPI001FB013AB|nr:hypothetical protein [Leptospira levettii]